MPFIISYCGIFTRWTQNLAIHVFPFAKCEKDSVEAICASWLEPSINVRGGYFYVPLIHSCFFLGGEGGGFLTVWILIPFVTKLRYTLPRYNPWQLFLKETPHFQSAPLSLCTLRSWPLLLWGLQLWNHKMTGSFSSNTCSTERSPHQMIYTLRHTLQPSKAQVPTERNLHIVNVNELVLQDVRPHFLTFSYS